MQFCEIFQPVFTFSKSTMEPPEQCVKSVQNQQLRADFTYYSVSFADFVPVIGGDWEGALFL